jgi:hypothetical protein
MMNLEQNSRVGIINSFLNLEPDVAFGSCGAYCKKCHSPLSYDEYFIVYTHMECGYKGYLTDKHKCNKRPINT